MRPHRGQRVLACPQFTQSKQASCTGANAINVTTSSVALTQGIKAEICISQNRCRTSMKESRIKTSDPLIKHLCIKVVFGESGCLKSREKLPTKG